MRLGATFLLFAWITVIPVAAEEAATKWNSLFDGKTLEGWRPLPGGTWEVKDGAIVEEGAPEKIFGAPESPRLRNFVAEVGR